MGTKWRHSREAFKKEVKVLSDLRHPNIIMLYGVCTRTGPPMMILEYMENGDLYQFLRRHEPEMAAYATSSNIQTLRLVIINCSLAFTAAACFKLPSQFSNSTLINATATRNCYVESNYLESNFRSRKNFRLLTAIVFFLPTFQWNFSKTLYDFYKILQSFYSQRCSWVRNGIKIVWLGYEKLSQN